MDERELGADAHVKQTTRTTTYRQHDPSQERATSPEQATRPTYEERYPHPAQGLDRDAARRRVEQNPAVMPPSPTPYQVSSWMNREFFGMRALPLMLVLGGGVLLPFALRLLGGRRRREERRAHRGEVGHKLREFWEENQTPRFIAFTSRPYGKEGKRGRGLFMAKLGPAKGE